MAVNSLTLHVESCGESDRSWLSVICLGHEYRATGFATETPQTRADHAVRVRRPRRHPRPPPAPMRQGSTARTLAVVLITQGRSFQADGEELGVSSTRLEVLVSPDLLALIGPLVGQYALIIRSEGGRTGEPTATAACCLQEKPLRSALTPELGLTRIELTVVRSSPS
jgi:hypothetical protein